MLQKIILELRLFLKRGGGRFCFKPVVLGLILLFSGAKQVLAGEDSGGDEKGGGGILCKVRFYFLAHLFSEQLKEILPATTDSAEARIIADPGAALLLKKMDSLKPSAGLKAEHRAFCTPKQESFLNSIDQILSDSNFLEIKYNQQDFGEAFKLRKNETVKFKANVLNFSLCRGDAQNKIELYENFCKSLANTKTTAGSPIEKGAYPLVAHEILQIFNLENSDDYSLSAKLSEKKNHQSFSDEEINSACTEAPPIKDFQLSQQHTQLLKSQAPFAPDADSKNDFVIENLNWKQDSYIFLAGQAANSWGWSQALEKLSHYFELNPTGQFDYNTDDLEDAKKADVPLKYFRSEIERLLAVESSKYQVLNWFQKKLGAKKYKFDSFSLFKVLPKRSIGAKLYLSKSTLAKLCQN